MKLADAFVHIRGDDSQLRQTLTKAKSTVGGWLRDVGQGIAQGIGQQVFRSVGDGVRFAVGEIRGAITASSDLTEALNKTAVAFGDQAKGVSEWSLNSATAFGQSRKDALEASATFGLLFSTMGLTRKASADMSTALVELASDLASINNIAPEEALIKLRAGLVGEVEPLRTVGVLLSAVAVETKAMEMGLASSTKALTEQDKVMARYQLILDQTALAQGDFARNAREIANQERILAAQRDNALATLGQGFTPIYAVILRGLNQLIGQVLPYGENIVRSLAEGMVNGIIYILPTLRMLRDVITYWLRPGSPPKLLPNLTKWGAGAVKAWLDGWGQADFGVLRGLGNTIENILRSFVGAGKLNETDLVSRVLGSQSAIIAAIDEFRRLGSVSSSSLDAIRRAAGPAGDSVVNLTKAYFELQTATKKATEAQRELTETTERYDKLLSPLQDQIDAITRQQQDLRDAARLDDLNEIIADPLSNPAEKQAAILERQRIELEKQQRAIEAERDTAVDAAEDKVDAAEKERQAAEEKLATEQEALDQQIKVNNLIAEEIALRERLANEALAAHEKKLRDLEAEQKKLTAAEKERHQELERIYQAQLSYNMATADTSGKIALMRLELSRYAEGSAEYYRILEQIHSLEQQRAKEGAGSGLPAIQDILPPVDTMGVPTWATELADKLDSEIEKAFGEKKDFGISIANGPTLLDRIIGPEPEKLPEVSDDVKNFVSALNGLTNVLGETNRIVGEMQPMLVTVGDAFTLFLNIMKGETKGGLDEVREEWRLFGVHMPTFLGKLWQTLLAVLTTIYQNFALIGKAALAGWQGDWKTAWENITQVAGNSWNLFKSLLVAFFGETATLIGNWLGETYDTIASYNLSGAASDFLGSMWTGLKNKWAEIQQWWEEKTAWFKNLMPTLPSWATGGFSAFGSSLGGTPGYSIPALSGVGGSTTTITQGPTVLEQNFYGPTDAAAVKSAGDDLLSVLHSKGIRR